MKKTLEEFVNIGIINQASMPGEGSLHMNGVGMLETDLGVAQAFFDP